MSEENTRKPPMVFAAIVSVMREIGATGISKSRNNQQQNYKFRGIDDVYNELNPILSKHGLAFLPRVVKREQVERTTSKGTPIFFTSIEVDFTLVCDGDGSSTSIRTVGEAMDSGDKSSNKALSAAYKYAAMMVFCIPTEGDNDADAISHEPSTQLPPVHKPSKNEVTRDEYTALAKQLADATTLTAVQKWRADNVATLDALPQDWKDELWVAYSDKTSELKKGLAA